jgi:nitroreductase
MDVKPAAEIGLFEALYTTRTLRRFKPDPVPDELLFQVVDAAIRAPTPGNSQSWHFILVKDADKRGQIARWWHDTWSASPYRRQVEDEATFKRLPRQQRLALRSVADLASNLSRVPVFLMVCGLRNASGSVFPAVQNALLACRGLGLASAVTSFHMAHQEEVDRLLGIPERQTAHVLLPIGYPVDKFGPVSRRPVKDVTGLNSWDGAWDYAQRQPEHGLRDTWVR